MLQISKSQMKNLKNPHFTDYELEVQREYKAPKVTITVRAGMKIWVQAVWLHTSQTLSYTFKQNRAKNQKENCPINIYKWFIVYKTYHCVNFIFFFLLKFQVIWPKKKKVDFKTTKNYRAQTLDSAKVESPMVRPLNSKNPKRIFAGK